MQESFEIVNFTPKLPKAQTLFLGGGEGVICKFFTPPSVVDLFVNFFCYSPDPKKILDRGKLNYIEL